MFVADGIKILKKNGLLNYIAPNNWTTNTGASKTRDFILKNTVILQLIDFKNFMIFDNASIQTMVMLFSKDKKDNYSFDFRSIITDKPVIQDITNLINKVNSVNIDILKPIINIEKYLDNLLTFNSSFNNKILVKLKNKQNFVLDEKNDIAQGIVPNPDVVSSKAFNLVKHNNVKIGDGVFVIDDEVKNHENFETNYLRPLYEPNMLDRYYFPSTTRKKIIYITKNNYQNDANNIIEHLQKFKEIMNERRENKSGQLDFFHLHWPRKSYFFEKGSKILCVRKSVGKPIFSYTENEAYVMMSINVIKTDRINLKYLTCLLNSKLIEFWLRNEGKMQGNNFQIDKGPILNIPIYKADEINEKLIITKVDEILALKQGNSAADTSALEREIDLMVYGLYGLSEEEIGIVENS